MPKSKSAEKRARQAEKHRLRNRAVRSTVRTYVGRARRLVVQSDVERAEGAVALALRNLDIAVRKGVLHRNNAARRKSRLMKALNTARQPQSPAA